MTRKNSPKILDLSLLAALLAAGACTEEGADPDDGEAAVEDDVDAEAAADEEELVEVDDLAAVPPPAGTSVWSEVLYVDGTSQQFMLHTTPEGVVMFEEMTELFPEEGLDRNGLPLAPEAAHDPCADDAYIHHGWRWDSKLKWYFHAGSTPGELNADAAESAIKAATSNITHSTNSCGLADEVSASHEYLGRKSKSANISSGGNCQSSDGTNMVSFGALPSGILATACVWFNNGVAKEGDVQLNKAKFNWTTEPGSSSCNNQFSVKAVMTHERGHTFGINHVSESSHKNMTMSPNINGPCQDGESTLGLGDVEGLRALY